VVTIIAPYYELVSMDEVLSIYKGWFISPFLKFVKMTKKFFLTFFSVARPRA
jgi:hypothetical protein